MTPKRIPAACVTNLGRESLARSHFWTEWAADDDALVSPWRRRRRGFAARVMLTHALPGPPTTPLAPQGVRWFQSSIAHDTEAANPTGSRRDFLTGGARLDCEPNHQAIRARTRGAFGSSRK